MLLTGIRLLSFFILLPIISLQASSSDIKMPFGRNNYLLYHKSSGLLDVFYEDKLIINQAYAEARIEQTIFRTMDYGEPAYHKTTVEDGFGIGEKHVLTYTGKNLPELQQIFYTYPDKAFFLAEFLLCGEALNSNYLAPLISKGIHVVDHGDLRTLFVPFDNDTFISYDAKVFGNNTLNTSAEVGVIYDNTSREGLIVGSLEQQVWKTGVKTERTAEGDMQLAVWSGYTDEKVTRDSMEHGAVHGQEIKSAKILVGFFDDWRDGLKAYGQSNILVEPRYIFEWNKPTPVGWNSWGVLQEKINIENTTAVVNFFADSLPFFRNEGLAFIDLDSFWDNMVEGGINGDFSQLRAFTDYCKSKGLEPGVYWAPFTDWGFRGGKKRKMEGSDYFFADAWTKVNGSYHDLDGGRALDPTHPGTRARMKLLIEKLKGCGFSMIKIDFLAHAAIESDGFYDSTITTGMQAYQSGMEYLVDLLDSKMLVYAAISPSLATASYAHMRRIACDAWKTIKDTQYTLNSINYGWWQDYMYDYIDADHVVFGEEREGVNRARFLSALVAGPIILGDDFSKEGPWHVRAQQLVQHTEILKIVKDGKAFRPVEGNTGSFANNLFVKETDASIYLAVFNFEEKPNHIKVDMERLGLDGKKNYRIVELLEERPIESKGDFEIPFKGPDAYIYKIDKQ